MLTGNQVRVRFHRSRIIPRYIDVRDVAWRAVAERLLDKFHGQEGRTRGEIEEDVRDSFGNDPAQLVHQGLAKLLEDRCEFEVVAGHPPEQLREAVFFAAGVRRTASATAGRAPFDRNEVLNQVARELGLTPEAVEQGLFADLKSEQRLVRFKDISASHLLERYNVALAQAVLLRSTGVNVLIRGESPQRYRQLLRLMKFHRLVCDIKRSGPNGYRIHLDGPLSLFTSTQKYGLQLALFLPAILLCRDFELEAEILWGPERKPKTLLIATEDGLVSHYPDTGMYVPPELGMFVDLFRKKITTWDISEESDILPLGDGFWVPDYRLTHKESGRHAFLEILGFWRRSSVEKHLQRLRRHATAPFVLAVSEQLRVDDSDLEGLPAEIHRFRQMPLPDEVVRLVEVVAKGS